VVGAYLEFFGEGTKGLTIGDRATISNMAPEYGATAALFAIDDQTIDYLRLTGREDDAGRAGRNLREAHRPGADALKTASTSACCSSTSRRWCATWPARRTRTARVPTSQLAELRGAVGLAEPGSTRPGRMPDGAVIIAAITSVHQHQQPTQRDRRGPAGAQRQPAGPQAQAVGQVVAGAGLQGGGRSTCSEAGLMGELEQLGFGVVAYACTTCNGMSGALDPKIQQEIVERDLYATAVLSGNRNFDGRIHPYAKQAFLASPPLVVAYAIAGTMRFDIERDVLTWSTARRFA
jgi:aconitase A